MLKKGFLYTLIILGFAAHIKGQDIMTVGNKKVPLAEFLRIYNKNSNLYKEELFKAENLKNYTDLYSLFVMKLQEADAQKLDTLPKIKSEIQTYKDQLAAKYNVENEALSTIVKEAYEREKNEYNVSHIMITLKSNSPADSLLALNEINSISDAIKQNKISYEQAAKTYSKDDATGKKGGKIGWITALQTPYDFETAFVKLKKGEVSSAVITKFGYHLIKLNDTRKNFGKYKVAQILMDTTNAGSESSAAANAQMVYQRALKGDDFKALVKQYSQDQYSLNNDGVLNWIGPGNTTEEFENTILGLPINGISKPLKTSYGYHIIKVLEHKPFETFEVRKKAIKSGLERDERGQLAKRINFEQLKKKLKVVEYPELIAMISKNVDTASLTKGVIKINLPEAQLKKILTVANKDYSFKDFNTYLNEYYQGKFYNDGEKVIKKGYDSYLPKVIEQANQEDLITNNVEYKNLIQDYKDGIMIFDLMEKNIWIKANSDTTGLKNYYLANATKYKWDESAEVEHYTSSDKKELELLIQVLGKETSVPEKAIEKVKIKFPNTDIRHQIKKMNINQFPVEIVSNLKTHQNSEIIMRNGKYELFTPLAYNPLPTQKTFEEAKGSALNDYQSYLESSWISSLKTKYPVNINKKVWDSLVK